MLYIMSYYYTISVCIDICIHRKLHYNIKNYFVRINVILAPGLTLAIMYD